MVVYCITNLINDKKYVGQTTKSLQSRWIAHLSKYSDCRYLKYAITKYGSKNFKIEILDTCNTLEEMNSKEEYFISFHKTLAPNGYNINTGGKNRLASQETRNLMSRSQKGIKKPKSLEHRAKISKTLTGSKQKQETKDKRAKKHFKKIFVPELERTFISIKEFLNEFNCAPSAVHRVLNGERKSWHGLTFVRVE